jgi:hypothetical protein
MGTGKYRYRTIEEVFSDSRNRFSGTKVFLSRKYGIRQV